MLNNPKANYIQRGEVIDYKNNGNAVIKANDVVVLTSRIGVAGSDIKVGDTGSLNVVGVYELPALNTESYTVGQIVYWKDDALTATQTGAVEVGWVVEPKATAATKARIKIG